jgi:hypothetical protein
VHSVLPVWVSLSLANLAVEQENLADALGDLAVAVEEIRAGRHAAGIDAEERELAELRLGHVLEDVGHGFRVVENDLGFIAVGVNRRDVLTVNGRGAVFGYEIHQPRDADVFLGRGGEERDEQFLLHRRVDAGAEFLLGQAALLEVFVHQAVV